LNHHNVDGGMEQEPDKAAVFDYTAMKRVVFYASLLL